MNRSLPSLERQFLLPFLVLITLIFLLSLGVSSYLRFEEESRALERKADSLLATYSLLLAEPIARQDSSALYSYLTALLANPEVARLQVVTTRNPEQPLIDVNSEKHQPAEGLLKSTSINFTDAKGVNGLARIELGLSDHQLWQQFRREFWMMAATLVVLLLCVAALTRDRLVRVVHTPLKQMLGAIDAFDASREPQALERSRTAEMDRLAGALTQLQTNVSALHGRMQSALIDKSEHLGRMIEGNSRAQQALKITRQLSNVTLNSLAEGVIATDWSGRISFVNAAAQELLTVDPGDAIDRPLTQVIRYASKEFDSFVDLALSSDDLQREQFDLHGFDELDQSRVFEVVASRFGGNDALGAGLVLIFRDVTEARRLQLKLNYEASHDSLTGLLNKRAFDRAVKQALSRSRAGASEAAVCFLDLDYFKTVNDTVGHAGGDRLLEALGEQIGGCVSEQDTLARLGGDEFAVLVARGGVGRAKQLCRNIIDRIAAYEFHYAGHRFRVGCSAGIVAVHPQAASADAVTDLADAACYRAKLLGRNRVHLHTGEPSPAEGNFHWLTALSEILEKDLIELWAQRICATDGRNRLDWFEVLARFRDGNGKVQLPESFIRAAERYDKIALLDLKVLDKTLVWMKQTIDSGSYVLRCSINLSGKTISNPDHANHILSQVRQAALPQGSVCFEITESELVQNLEAAQLFFAELRRLGCLIALDDFGTGICSFAYLRDLNLDFVKIDGQFIRAMGDSEVDRKVVESICSISGAMGVNTIAEYVDDRKKFATLAAMNIGYGQGFGLHKPVPLSEIKVGEALSGRSGAHRRWRDQHPDDGKESAA